MRTCWRILATAAALALITAGSPRARAADDEARGFGISLDGELSPAWDGSVTSTPAAAPQRRWRLLVGLTTLMNFGPYAAGAVVDGTPGIFGNGRLTVGGLAGWQPRIGTHRFQLLGEVGGDRFTDPGGDFFTTVNPHEIWLAYLGGRLGVSEALGRGGHFVVGGWLFVRRDLGNATAVGSGFGDGSPTDFRVGGTTAGLVLRLGLRFDQHRPAPEDEPVEVTAAR